MPAGVDHTALFECIELAVKKAKSVTNIVRNAWEKKDSGYGLLDLVDQ